VICADDIIKSVLELPSLPAVVNDLLATMEEDDFDMHVLAAKITLDQALSAKTLRLANSSFYGLQAKVTTIGQAVSVLGFHSIRTLVTACSVTSSFSAHGSGAFDFNAFWRHSIASAVCARVIAPHLQINPDTAFTAGLLHDLGTLVLATRFSSDYQRVLAWQREQDCTISVAELAVFGTDHAAIGAALAAHWKFPAQIQAAVAGHHLAGPVDGVAPADLSTVVIVANALAHALDLAEVEGDQVPPLPMPIWRALALDHEAWERVFSNSEQLFHATCQALTT
jgi:putative nucleotidyltransferase with HDIG domain